MLPSLPTLCRLADGLGIPEAVLLPAAPDPEQQLLRSLRDRGVRI